MTLRFGPGRRGPGMRASSGASADPWTPAQLFAAAELGAWYDPSDLSSLFQDAAGTTPVTAAGQPVGKVTDKSGNGNHLTAAGTARPTLEVDGNGFYYLKGDGIDAKLVAPAAEPFPVLQQMTAFVARQPDSSSNGMVFEYGLNVFANAGAFAELYLSAGTDEIYCAGNSVCWGDLTGLGTSAIIGTLIQDMSLGTTIADVNKYRTNGTLRTFNSVGGTVPDNTSRFFQQELTVFCRSNNSLPYDGRIYSLIIRFAASTADEIDLAEAWINERMGAF